MLIGVDLDEVLAEFTEGFLAYHNESEGTGYRKEDFHTYHFEEIIGGSKKEVVGKILEFYKSPEFGGTKPVDGSVEAIRLLRQQHQLVVVTARPISIRQATEQWLLRHFPEMFDDIYYTYNPYSGRGDSPKSAVCLERNINILIDDAPENIMDFTNHPTRVLLFERPWNKIARVPENIQRVSSWQEIVSAV